MPCRDCQHFLPSDQRPGLSGFGYCNAAPDIETRARFFRDDGECWLVPNVYQERKPS